VTGGPVRIRGAELPGAGVRDVRLRNGRVEAIAPSLPVEVGERVVEAEGGALLPGLVDHHLHLLAWAAARCSISCGPPDVTEEEALRAALGRAPGSGWIRGVGYHESVAGTLDRRRLDALAPGRPVRVQHRTGACWMLSSAAMQALAVDTEPEREGIERGADGRPTGRLFRMDAWLGERLRGASDEGPPDLTACGQELSTRGVVDVTDATPTAGAAEVAHFARARQSGALPQRLHLLGSPTACAAPGVAVLGRKLVIDEWALPLPDALADRIREAHSVGSPVAIHAVTRAELAVAAAALEEAGVVPGDRIEHAAVAPPDIVAWLAALGRLPSRRRRRRSPLAGPGPRLR
jgi:predicted amidohydrolase YtcJ